MKELLLDYAAYHIWANELILNRLATLASEKWTQEVGSSFPSIRATVLHMWDAEAIWQQRLKKISPVVVPGKTFTGDNHALVNAYKRLNNEWGNWLSTATVGELGARFSYTNLKGQPFESAIHHTVLHLFNHGTYHRGQLVSILRQLGETDIPQTDFIHWSRLVSESR